ncbi:MAG: hypothetical protein QOF51_607 [Chloroflexota bacterium]|jgi:hypothetical protein|nr:hypothetical protein [Chloroflexota bacterium]
MAEHGTPARWRGTLGIILGVVIGMLLIQALAIPGISVMPRTAEAQPRCGAVTAELAVACTPTPSPGRSTATPTLTHTPSPTPSPTATSAPEAGLRPPNQGPAVVPTGLISTNPGTLQLLQTVHICDSVNGDTFGIGDPYLTSRYIIEPDFSSPKIVAYLRFDLSSIPAGATITSANLRLYLEQGSFDSPLDMQVWRVTGAWTPQTLSLNNQPGFAYPAVQAAISTAPGYKSWNVTNMTRGWVSGAAANYGMRVWTEDASDYDARFHKDQTLVARGSQDLSPCLDVTYAPPTATPAGNATPVATWTSVPTPTQVPQPTLATGDLQTIRMDVIQTTSARFGTSDPDIALIADKTTLVRVYVSLADASADRNASVTLKAFRNGSQQSGGAGCTATRNKAVHDWDLTNPILALVFGPLERDDLSQTFNFQLDASCPWVNQGDVTFRASVSGPECLFCGDNNTLDQAVTFHKIRPMVIKPYLITYDRPGSPYNGAVPTWSTSGFDTLRSMYPIPESITVKSRGHITAKGFDLDVYPGHDPSEVDVDNNPWWVDFGNLLDWFKTYSDGGADVSLGALAPNMPAGCYGISSSHRAITLLGCGGTYAHEFGHAFGLAHSGNDHGECAGGSCDVNWPYPHGGTVGLGWDFTRPNELIVPDDGTVPWHSHDVMSYGFCDPAAPTYGSATYPWYCATWTSPINYLWIAQRLNCATPQWNTSSAGWQSCMQSGPFSIIYQASQQPELAARLTSFLSGLLGAPPSGANPPPLASASVGARSVVAADLARGVAAQAAQPTGERDYIRIQGSIRGEADAKFDPFYVMTLPLGSGDQSGEGRYRIEIRSANGAPLATRNFNPDVVMAHAALSLAWIDETMPWSPDAATIILSLDGRVLAERSVSAATPQVTLTSPNGGELWAESGEFNITWTAGDADGDDLAFWLQFSADGGASWDTIRRNVEGTSYTVDLRDFPGSDRALVRIFATDGVNTALDASDAPYRVARKAPEPEISGASDGVELQAGSAIRLRGLATDAEDGMLDSRALSWTSDKDGPLGTGEVLYLTGLSQGEHVITMTAVDSDGMQGTATLRVTAR